jgi:selenocysteine lyase/cysteine desulfurase
MNLLAHLNAAGAALPLQASQDAALAHMREEARVGPHWAAAAAAGAIDDARSAAARLFGAPASRHIAFGETATRLWAAAFGAMTLHPGARILIGRCEWGGNILNALKRARAVGATIEVLPSDRAGRIDVDALELTLDERVAAICIPASSSGLGVAQPVEEIGRLPRPEHCLLFVDAAQAAGRIPVGLDLWRADVVVAPARKWLRGPRGQAVMALSSRGLGALGDPPLLDQAGSAWVEKDRWATRDDAARFESYEFSVAGRLGFGQALAHAERELPNTQPKLAATLRPLQAALASLPHVAVFEEMADDTAFLTFICAGEAPSSTVARLREAGVAIAVVGLGYARLELESRGLTEVCRVSPHAYTTLSEADYFLEALADSGDPPRRAVSHGAG